MSTGLPGPGLARRGQIKLLRGFAYKSSASVVNDDSCGVHSRPYHSCVIACVMQVREEHAMGHDSGVQYLVCVSVCRDRLSVCLYTTILALQAAYERYQPLQCYKGMKIKKWGFC